VCVTYRAADQGVLLSAETNGVHGAVCRAGEERGEQSDPPVEFTDCLDLVSFDSPQGIGAHAMGTEPAGPTFSPSRPACGCAALPNA
jgi:hypothetical protein